MALKAIEEIRILPPLAFSRLGASPEPMSNYYVEPNDRVGFRTIKPARTYLVDPTSGEISGTQIPDVAFKDTENRVKPVCPFLELWVRYQGSEDLVPLSVTDLTQLGVSANAVVWSFEGGNKKMLRRTGDPNDRISVEVNQLSDHARKPLLGTCENFKNGKRLPMGWIHYIKPNDAFPEIRLRITPPAGLVYGDSPDTIIKEDRALYDATKGRWRQHDGNPPSHPELPLASRSTMPGEIYAKAEKRDADGRLIEETNLGYFDDTWDAILKVTLSINNTQHQAIARVAVGPPDYAPDSFPVRTLADDLEQMVSGPEAEAVSAEEVLDIVRRAFETMQLMDTEFLNSERYNNRFPAGARYQPARKAHKALLDALQGLHADEGSSERASAVSTLKQIQGRLRHYAEVWKDFSSSQQMPAMMRNADGGNLSLTRRMLSKIRLAVDTFDSGSDPEPEPDNRATSFKLHIRPLMRKIDIDNMKFKFDLSQYADVVANANGILGRLNGSAGPVMPPENQGGPWPEEWIQLFERWIQEKHPE